jgi:hypothetical protein
MDQATSSARVKRRRDKMREAGLRPIQIWVTDTRRPGFAEECRRQSIAISRSDATAPGRSDTEFWERASADAWDDLA